jgi:hypothetical protein
MNTAKCPICLDKADGGCDPATRTRVYTCGRCGPYELDDDLLDGEEIRLGKDERWHLSCLLAERHVHGLSAIRLTAMRAPDGWTNVGEYLGGFPKEPLEFYDRAIVNLGKLARDPVGTFLITPHTAALCFTESVIEAARLMQRLTELSWVQPLSPLVPDQSHYVVLPEGWRRIEKLRMPGRDSRQAFVAMWFDPSRAVFFDQGFKSAIEDDQSTKAVRIDRKETNKKIDDEIIAEIRRSRYLVADVTKARGGVYFEAGFALGLGLPVIWCVEKGRTKDMHFDTRQYSHIIYSDPADLKTKLLNRIRATIV